LALKGPTGKRSERTESTEEGAQTDLFGATVLASPWRLWVGRVGQFS
jgi:hypothetical protein